MDSNVEGHVMKFRQILKNVVMFYLFAAGINPVRHSRSEVIHWIAYRSAGVAIRWIDQRVS